jgi:hypothetical protein
MHVSQSCFFSKDTGFTIRRHKVQPSKGQSAEIFSPRTFFLVDQHEKESSLTLQR